MVVVGTKEKAVQRTPVALPSANASSTSDDGRVSPIETYDRDVEIAAWRVATRQGASEQEHAELARAIDESSARMTEYMLARARARARRAGVQHGGRA